MLCLYVETYKMKLKISIQQQQQQLCLNFMLEIFHWEKIIHETEMEFR